ncbi:unnamed protein product [Sphenostylis stenocarpa]|uniref:Bifunctional inhibitor/plant lipid transfer protein/seed storage helical domain-containing protein n=1 Tax=Sphenostylis stenocarpa TaxID=92480 RepID=A0AA86TFD6_9FABA|nr:unnamed protein product [Sphenostylis stenocarpa]CAJ1975647.1 unnamed protein product [Sphenostylis stenocarpa]
MDSKGSALLLALNLLSFAMLSSAAAPAPSGNGVCPVNTLDLTVCLNLANGLVDISSPPASQCCSLIADVVDLNVIVQCLCITIKAGPVTVNVNANLSSILNNCKIAHPSNLVCP